MIYSTENVFPLALFMQMKIQLNNTIELLHCYVMNAEYF